MIKLYGYWRSLAAYRVRVALNLKGLTFTEEIVDLATDAQLAPAFRALNPQGAVPTVVIDGGPPLTQSLAIMELLDELHPEPPLLPTDPLRRAYARSLALLFAADHHPLITPRVTRYLRSNFAADDDKQTEWVRHWVHQSLQEAEARLVREHNGSSFCHSDLPGIADICLASQVLGAKAFNVDLTDTPHVNRISAACLANEAFSRAHPLRQPRV
jgi:maleylacetoacetate isomerase